MFDQALASCVDVGRTYGSGDRAVVAVYGVTCTIESDDQIAIMGPSGSGKSTLLHLIAGLETHSAGEISWPALGGTLRAASPHIGVVFQAPTLIPA